MDSNEFVSFRELWRIFWERKKRILLISFAVSILIMIVSFFLPKIYTAETVLLMPESEMGGGGGIVGALGISGFEMEEGITSQVIKIFILSKSCRRKIVEKFSLIEVYGARDMSEALEILEKRTSFGIFNIKGEILFEVEDRDPERAVEISKYYLQVLEEFNKKFNLTSKNPVVKIIDPPTPPNFYSSPKIKLNMMGSFLLTMLILISFYVFTEKRK